MSERDHGLEWWRAVPLGMLVSYLAGLVLSFVVEGSLKALANASLPVGSSLIGLVVALSMESLLRRVGNPGVAVNLCLVGVPLFFLLVLFLELRLVGALGSPVMPAVYLWIRVALAVVVYAMARNYLVRWQLAGRK